MIPGEIKGQIKTPSILRLGEGRGAGICVSTYGSRGTTFIRRYVSVATLVCMDNSVVVVPLARLRGLPTRSTFDGVGPRGRLGLRGRRTRDYKWLPYTMAGEGFMFRRFLLAASGSFSRLVSCELSTCCPLSG
jgi:hypothetical protein